MRGLENVADTCPELLLVFALRGRLLLLEFILGCYAQVEKNVDTLTQFIFIHFRVRLDN